MAIVINGSGTITGVSAGGLPDDSVDAGMMAANSIDSDAYVDASIDAVHLSANSVDSDAYVDASIDNAHLADDAVGVAELSATGTASNSTYLRGDNTWATVSSFDPDGAVVFNDSGNDVDFRIEADDDVYAFVVNGEQGNVGIGNAGTQSEFSVTTGGATGGGQTMGIQVRQNGYSGYKSGMTAGDTSDTTYNCGFIGFMGGTHTGNGERHIVFDTRPGTTDAAPTERMRIDSDGQVLIGTTNNTSVLGVNSADTGNYAVTINGARASGGTGHMVDFHENSFAGNRMGTITSNGGSIAYNTTSDYRLKENVDYDFDAITRLKQLKPARFNWIADDTNTLIDGFLAHEVSSIVPEAVTGEKDAMRTEEYIITPEVIAIFDDDGNIITEPVEAVMGEREVISPQGIDQSKLVPLLVGALQEAITRIEALENP